MGDLKSIADNIRFYRKKQGLTQSELAEKMNVSFQAISSWETATTVPDIANFVKLTEVFKISADSLLTPRFSEKKHFIGIDGGGTKTEFVLFTSDGTVVKSLKLKATNPDTEGLESTLKTLRQGIEACLEACPRIDGIFAGLAGSYQDKITDYFYDKFPKFPFFIDSDAVNILADNGCDIGFICGTGSIIMARVNGKNHFVGGWGHELGDAGSAYNLGRAAMRAALSMEDGVGESTLICQFLREKLGLLPNERLFDKIDSVCQNGTTFIASLSTTVFSAAKTGDRAANEILSLEFKELMQEINIARRIYGCKNRVAAAGGVIEHNRELVLPILKKYADEDIEFVFSDLPPVYGACIECCNRLNVELSDGFYRRFKKTYNAY